MTKMTCDISIDCAELHFHPFDPLNCGSSCQAYDSYSFSQATKLLDRSQYGVREVGLLSNSAKLTNLC